MRWTYGGLALAAGLVGLAGLTGCPDPAKEAAEEEAKVAAAMDQLEERAAAVRDAVVRGDLPEARAKAGQLAADLPPLPAEPPGYTEQLKLALADVSGASTLADAARGVGKVTRVCADCHVAGKVGSAGRPLWEVTPTRIGEMARHARSVDQLWLAAIHGGDEVLASAVAAQEQAAKGPEGTAIDDRVAELARALQSAPPAGRAQAYADLLTLCAGCHAASRPRALPKIEGVALPDLQPAMDDHFLHALELQLAVTGGDLDAAHRAAQALTETRVPDVPAAAQAHLDTIRAAADRAAVAPTLGEVAKATGDIALACGACHTATGGGPKGEIPAPPGTDQHMGLHLYGAYWLGYGVSAPDERAWKAGATALSKAKLLPEGWKPPAGSEPVDDQVHALAQKALTTTEPAARAALWGELLQSCAPCHLALPR